jgi:hypothetical protein
VIPPALQPRPAPGGRQGIAIGQYFFTREEALEYAAEIVVAVAALEPARRTCSTECTGGRCCEGKP